MVHAYAARRTSDRGVGRSRWDEMVGFHGRVRRGWRELSTVAERLGPDGLAAAASETGRLLAEDGVSHRPLGAPEDQAWALDPLPMFLDEGEWAVLEHGLAQRAELLDRLAADLYGPRRVLRAGALPAEIVYAHPGFLRAWCGVTVPTGRQIFLAAADIARADDGSWCLLTDRVQAPSGAGYAMANRRVVSRVLPGLHSHAEIHRIGPFFHAMRLGLEQLAPPTAESPRTVLLTPGPGSETAYEQTFLAALLGYPLVRGSDLVVADGRVWQLTLGRREPVDVILRRVDAWFCDPLDLRPDSELGVPGLIEAARLGTVTVVNSLGAGVLENPGLLPYLPAVSRLLLDEPLRLKSAPTWWCGEPAGRSHVLARLAGLVVKPLAQGVTRPAVCGWELTEAQLGDLRDRIGSEPHAWVGQEPVAGSTVPGVVPEGLHAQDLTLRTFAVAAAADWQVMPGGLGRVRDGSAVRAAGASKDVWIRNTRGASVVQPWVREATPSQVAPMTVSPRVIEDMFWLGRYAARAEDTARLLRAVADRWADFRGSPEPAGGVALLALLETLTNVTATWPGFVGPQAAARFAAPGVELASLLLDEDREGTLAYAVRRLTSVAGDVREQLSTDTWLVLGSLHRELAALRAGAGREGPPGGLEVDTSTAIARVLEGLLALSGLIAESLVRDTGWRFLDLGRRIERALGVVALLAAGLGTERDADSDSLVVESVLIAAESIITYRRRYQARAGVATVLDLLVCDRENPRSVAYQLDRAGESLDRIPADPDRLDAVRGPLIEMRARLRSLDTVALARSRDGGVRLELQALLGELTAGLHALDAGTERAFFVHNAPQRPLAAVPPPTEAW